MPNLVAINSFNPNNVIVGFACTILFEVWQKDTSLEVERKHGAELIQIQIIENIFTKPTSYSSLFNLHTLHTDKANKQTKHKIIVITPIYGAPYVPWIITKPYLYSLHHNTSTKHALATNQVVLSSSWTVRSKLSWQGTQNTKMRHMSWNNSNKSNKMENVSIMKK